MDFFDKLSDAFQVTERGADVVPIRFVVWILTFQPFYEFSCGAGRGSDGLKPHFCFLNIVRGQKRFLLALLRNAQMSDSRG